MIDVVKAFSRPLGVARAASHESLTAEDVRSKRVVLTGDANILSSANGRWALLDSLRLLLRIAGDLTIILPPGATTLARDVQSIVSTAGPLCNAELRRGPDEVAVHQAGAILNVGFSGRPELPWTCINSNGWVVRVASSGSTLPDDVGQDNPIGALCAASIGVAEVFKRLVGIPANVAPLLDANEFSLFTYSSVIESSEPPLPEALFLPNTLMVGGGAIGNGIALLLSQLRGLRGRVHIVDKQAYGDENFGTCVLLGANDWVGESKALRLANWIRAYSALDVTGERAFIKAALDGDSVRGLSPELVINGLDDVAARHDVQLAWPAHLVDGGISDIGFAVVQHRIDNRELACLRCTFQAPAVDHRAQQRSWTGLDPKSLVNIDRALTDEDIARAVPDRRNWLNDQRRLGKTICSVITEASLAALGVKVAEDFRPSVPFVATASAALVVAETIKALMFPERTCPQTFAVGNIFLGFESSATLDRPAASACECVAHRPLIERLRARRLKVTQPTVPRLGH